MAQRIVEAEDQSGRLRFDEAELKHFCSVLNAHAPWRPPAGDIAVSFVDTGRCVELHGQFFDDPTPTDVMTFPGDPADGHAGDIAICVDFAEEAAAEEGTSVAYELCLYLVHAWLHLAGLRDDSPDAVTDMRNAESQLLALLKEHDAMIDFRIVPSRTDPTEG